VLDLRIDDLTAPENLPRLSELWQQFLEPGSQTGIFELLLPEGQRVRVAYGAAPISGSADHQIGILNPNPVAKPVAMTFAQPGDLDVELSAQEGEIVARVAMGDSGQAIAADLDVSDAAAELQIRDCLLKLGAEDFPHAVLIALGRGDISFV